MPVSVELLDYMPVRFPSAHAIRAAVVERAAELAGASIEHMQDLIGPVEPVKAVGEAACAWRVAHYFGGFEVQRAIEQASSEVRREMPLMSAHQH